MTDQQHSIDWAPLRQLLDKHQRFVLTSHVRPDCDALGSELGMASLLRQLGKDVRIINADPTPPRLAFVDPDQHIEVLGSGVEPDELDQCDVIMVLDTSAWRQLGAMAELIRNSQKQIVVIDHHASEGELPAVVFKDAQAEATGRLVFDAAQFLNVSVTIEMASALFAAIATDTGWFRFPSTTAGTYHVIGELVARGACPSEIFRQLYERDSMSRAKLRGIVLSRMVTEIDGRLAHTHVLAEDFAETGALPSETEDFVNMALAIAGTEVAVMLTEQPVGTVKASFRSRSSVDCSQLAATFDGGGHKAAAGATLHGPFETVQLRVLDALRERLAE
jgi:phosphoesterase RecJ-like protein